MAPRSAICKFQTLKEAQISRLRQIVLNPSLIIIQLLRGIICVQGTVPLLTL